MKETNVIYENYKAGDLKYTQRLKIPYSILQAQYTQRQSNRKCTVTY